jgi:hypothetical protein
LKKMTRVVAKRRMKNKEIEAASGKDHDKAVQKEEKNLMSRVTNFFFGKNK